jgi:hypothetical protein
LVIILVPLAFKVVFDDADVMPIGQRSVMINDAAKIVLTRDI